MKDATGYATPTFDLPGKAISEAVSELRRLDRTQNVSVHAYAASAQTLLAALVQLGWTIEPPRDVASQQR